MKTVYDKYMVAHLWANQSQSTARTSTGNFSFNGPELRSYRTVIGYRFPFGAVLTDYNHSATTSRHLSIARNALRNGAPVFYLESVPSSPFGCVVDGLRDAAVAHGKTAGKRPGYGPHAAAVARRNAYLKTVRAAAVFVAADRTATAQQRAAARKALRDTENPDQWAAGIQERADRAALRAALDTAAGLADVLPRELVDARDPDALGYTIERAYRTANAYELQRADAIRLARKLNARIPAAARSGLPELVREASALMDAARDRQAAADYRTEMTRAYAGRRNGAPLSSYGYHFSRAEQYRPECPDARRLADRYRTALEWHRADTLASRIPELIADCSRYSSPGDRVAAAERAARELARIPERHPKRSALVAAYAAMPVDQWRAEWAAYRADLLRSPTEAFRAAGRTSHALLSAPVMLWTDGQVVRTSHGAYVTATAARIVWREVERAAGKLVTYPGEGVGVGAFKLRTVRPDGSVQVGCHDIPADELRNTARALGFTVATVGGAA